MATGDPLLDFAVSVRSALLTPFMRGVSESNSELAYLVLLPLVYWIFSRRIGILLVVADAFGTFASVFLKDALALPRPPDSGETAWLGRADGFGFPSGHTTAAATNWATLAAALKSRKVALFGTAVVASVGFSRLYLGVHYSGDVAGGALIGLAIGLAVLFLGPGLASRLDKVAPRSRYALALVFPVLLVLDQSNQAIIVLLSATGACVGHLLATERKWVLATGDPRKLPLFGLLRLAIGLPVLGLLALGLGSPTTSPPAALALRFLALGFFMTALGPRAFLWAEARLAKKSTAVT